MSAPVFDFKIQFRPGFQADMDARFARLQFAFSQKVADVVDKYVPLDSGQLKGSVNGAASDFKDGKLVYNTPYARKQYYLHEQGTDLHGARGETERHRGSYWGQNAIADHKSWKSSPTMPQSSFWEGTNEPDRKAARPRAGA